MPLYNCDTVGENNPWQNGTSLPEAKRSSKIVAALALFVASLALPLAPMNEWISLGALALLFLYVALSVRLPSAVTLLLVTAFAMTTLTSLFSVGAIVLSLVVGVACGAFLFTTLRRWYLALPIFAGAFLLTLLITGSPSMAALTLVPLPATFLLSVATVLARHRTSAICWTLFGLLLSVAVALAWVLLAECRRYGIGVTEYLAQLRGEAVNLLIRFREEYFALVQSTASSEMGTEMSAELASSIELLQKQFDDVALTDLVAQTFNILPAIAVILCSIVAFEAQLMLNTLYRSSGLSCVVTPTARIFTMSVFSAVIYFIAFLVATFIGGDGMAMAVIRNLHLMLLPGFCVLGAQTLFAMFSHTKGAARVFWTLLVAALFCCAFGTAIQTLAFFGTYQCIMSALRNKLLQKMQESGRFPPDQSDDGDDE